MEHISLDNYHFSILAKIYDKPYIPFTELAASYPSSDYRRVGDAVLLLSDYELIQLREASSAEEETPQQYCVSYPEDNAHLVATTKGAAIMEEHNRRDTQLQSLREIAERARSMAESAETQAKLAKEAAESARADAVKARRDALFSKIMAVAAIVVALIQPFLSAYVTEITDALSRLFA